MKKVIIVLTCILMLFPLVSCNGEKAGLETMEFTETDVSVTEEVTKPAEKEFYERSDFDSLVIGKSTFDDLLKIAPESVIEEIDVGKYCKYPTKDGGLIYVEIYKKHTTSELFINNIYEIPKVEADSITVNGIEYTSEQINEMFCAILNTFLYENGSVDAEKLVYNTKLMTENEIEYDLYYDSAYFGSTALFAVININDGSETQKYYEIMLRINERGIENILDLYAEIDKAQAVEISELKAHLGHFSFHSDGVTKPEYEVPDDEWKTNTEQAISAFVEQTDEIGVDHYPDMTGQNETFVKGEYTVYVKGFLKADDNTRVLFVNESTGKKYISDLYYLRETQHDFPANIDDIFLDVTDAFDSVREFSSIPENSPLIVKCSKK